MSRHGGGPRYGVNIITILGDRFAEAERYVSSLHDDQRRKGTNIPYVSHLLTVVSLVLDQDVDEDEAMARCCTTP